MRIAIIVAKSSAFRLVLGGLIGGVSLYCILISYPEFARFAVPSAAIAGALACFARGHIQEALVKGLCVMVVLILGFFALPKILENDSGSYLTNGFGFLFGSLGGVTVGGILGGVFREIWDPYLHCESETETAASSAQNKPE